MGKNKEINQLVLQMQNGDEQALASLYDKYCDALYGLILRIVRDDAIAQDVLQDAFVKIWQKAKSYSPTKGTIFTWMLNICRNKAIDELRKINRVKDGKIQLADSSVYKMNGVETKIDAIGLKDIVEKLPEKHRLMVEYIYFRGYTQQEVSDELNIPLGTVKTRARSALITLAESFVIIILIWILKST